MINSTNFPHHTFLVILSSSETLAKSTMYVVLTNNTEGTSGIDFTRIDANDGTIPIITKLNSGGIGVLWSRSAIALIRINVIKLSSLN